MPVTAAAATPIQFSGIAAASVGALAYADAATDVQFYGLPAAVPVLTPPAPTTSPDAVRARVLDYTGAFIAHLPHAEGLRWMDEANTSGSGSIDYRRYDDVEMAHANLWAPTNQVMITVGDRDIFRLILDAQGGYRIDPVTGDRIDSWGGTGQLGVVNSGLCAPEYGWRPEATEERTFDYGSNPAIGGWYVASEWKRVVGKLIRDSWRWTYKKRHQPKGWPERKAEWIWWRNPDSTSGVDETCYIGASFTVPSPGKYKIWVAGDDTLEFQLDGEIRATTGPGGWRKATKIVMRLSAGTHYVAAKVQNTPASDGNQNRSGFICAIGRVNGNGDITKWALRTSSSGTTWKIRRQLSNAPGWYAAQILRQLVAEQQARGCAGHTGITFGFTTAADSSGVPWAGRQELSITVGTQALDYIQTLVETGMDVAMTPGLVLNAWRKRGVDRSSWVRLDQSAAHALDESAAQLPGIRNVAYAKASTGWVSRTDSASVGSAGQRETMIALGGSQSPAQTDGSIAAMLPDLSAPPQTIEVHLSGAVGSWQPYRDFDVLDWVSYRALGATTWGRYRVMSISGEVNPAGYPDWTLQLYKD